MSNYLTNIRINNLQNELRVAELAQGFVTPMVVNIDGNGKAITNLGEIQASQGTLANVNATSITTTGAVHAESLVLDTDLTVPGLKSQSVFAPAGQELNLDNTTAGERIFVGYASSGTKVYTGELHPDAVLVGSISCTQIDQTTNGGDPVGTFQAGIREGVVTADGLIINTIGAHDNPSITFTSPIVLAAGQVFDGLDVNFLAIGNSLYTNTVDSNPAYLTSNTGTTSFVADVEFTRDVSFTQPLTVDFLKIAANGSITCGTDNNIYDISDVGTLSAENIVTTEGIQATGDVSADTLISNAVEIKDGTKAFVINPSATPNPTTGYPYLDLVYTDGTTTVNSKIYDELLNPPPSVVANTLAGILANSGDGGGYSITNTSSITTTKLIAPEIQFPSSVVSLTVQNSTSSGVGSVFDSLYNPPTMNLFNPSLVNFGSSISFNASKDFGRIFAISLASAYTSNFTSVEVTFDSLTIEITAWLPDAFVTGSMTYYLSFDPTTTLNAYPMTTIINSDGNINFTTTKAILLSQSYTATNYPSKVYFMVKCASAPPQTTVVNFQSSFTNCSVSLVSSTVGTATIVS